MNLEEKELNKICVERLFFKKGYKREFSFG